MNFYNAVASHPKTPEIPKAVVERNTLDNYIANSRGLLNYSESNKLELVNQIDSAERRRDKITSRPDCIRYEEQLTAYNNEMKKLDRRLGWTAISSLGCSLLMGLFISRGLTKRKQKLWHSNSRKIIR
ncbi:MAG: hypothetical protein KJ718_01565 [Nanoarchaeota archaeon]|nr:hypothetical protein [Nanoarchaeota archaeon]MBU1051222.1 hypothetical protein [Nanoarchaeota archaeon]MBU1988067.1 hypothetical protein [Nanoarchaeota archaeon]